ncbi:MAG: hypothetical protein J6Y79_02785 [Paludibacteraceae bacterium]|nr:hypothetical protein [Paludibacteraceae bacterium]
MSGMRLTGTAWQRWERDTVRERRAKRETSCQERSSVYQCSSVSSANEGMVSMRVRRAEKRSCGSRMEGL